MVNTVWVNSDYGRDFHPLTDRLTKLHNFTKEENRDFSTIIFSLQLMQSCLVSFSSLKLAETGG